MSAKRLHTFKHRFMISFTMTKVILVVSLFCQFGHLLSITVNPHHRNLIVSPHFASGDFNTRGERQILGLTQFPEYTAPVAAPAAPVAAIAPVPHLGFAAAPIGSLAPAAPVAFGTPATAVAPAASLPVAASASVAPVTPILAKVAQFKLSYPQYAYGYSVQDFTTGDNKVAKEIREGEVVKGSYSVADPDGTKRTVNYYADPVHGFNAVVHKTQILK